MEGYRSGHNGVVLKTIRGKPHAGSNPAPSATICPKTRFECEFSDIFVVIFRVSMQKMMRAMSHGFYQGLDSHQTDRFRHVVG